MSLIDKPHFTRTVKVGDHGSLMDVQGSSPVSPFVDELGERDVVVLLQRKPTGMFAILTHDSSSSVRVLFHVVTDVSVSVGRNEPFKRMVDENEFPLRF